MDEVEPQPAQLPQPSAPRPPTRWERWMLALAALTAAGTLVVMAIALMQYAARR
jgi:hypothetical protein